MRCNACRKKCFPIQCPYCDKKVCIPCRSPDQHVCVSSEELNKHYENKLRIQMDARGQLIPGSKHWNN